MFTLFGDTMSISVFDLLGDAIRIVMFILFGSTRRVLEMTSEQSIVDATLGQTKLKKCFWSSCLGQVITHRHAGRKTITKRHYCRKYLHIHTIL